MSEPTSKTSFPVPVGLQTLLRMAAVDPAFRQELVQRRAEVATVAGVTLTRSEQAVLAALPDDQLRQMAAQLPPPPPKRRAFLRQTAATAVVLLGGAALAASMPACCDDEGSVPRPDFMETQKAGGAAPDLPPEPEPMPADDDSAEAPERADNRAMDIGGGAAPDVPEDHR